MIYQYFTRPIAKLFIISIVYISIAKTTRTKSYKNDIKRDEGEGVKIREAPNTNLLTQNTEIPAIKYESRQGMTKIETNVETEIFVVS